MKILAFAGSNSSKSINKQFVTWVSAQFTDDDVRLLDLNDFEMPIYSPDREGETGIPKQAQAFAKAIDEVDLILLSLAEHNGAYSAAFKNVFDWVSRIPNRTVFEQKRIFLMAAAPGPRGGSSVLEIAKNRFPFNGGSVVATFSLPKFHDNFKDGILIHEELKQEVLAIVEELKG